MNAHVNAAYGGLYGLVRVSYESSNSTNLDGISWGKPRDRSFFSHIDLSLDFSHPSGSYAPTYCTAIEELQPL